MHRDYIVVRESRSSDVQVNQLKSSKKIVVVEAAVVVFCVCTAKALFYVIRFRQLLLLRTTSAVTPLTKRETALMHTNAVKRKQIYRICFLRNWLKVKCVSMYIKHISD